MGRVVAKDKILHNTPKILNSHIFRCTTMAARSSLKCPNTTFYSLPQPTKHTEQIAITSRFIWCVVFFIWWRGPSDIVCPLLLSIFHVNCQLTIALIPKCLVRYSGSLGTSIVQTTPNIPGSDDFFVCRVGTWEVKERVQGIFSHSNSHIKSSSFISTGRRLVLPNQSS